MNTRSSRRGGHAAAARAARDIHYRTHAESLFAFQNGAGYISAPARERTPLAGWQPRATDMSRDRWSVLRPVLMSAGDS